MEAFLDALVRFFAFLVVAVPVTILIIGIIAYFVFPHHGMVTGMILTACGSFGLLIFSMVLYNLAIKQSVSMTIIFLVAVELVTLFLGIISLIKIRIKKKHN